MFWRNTIEPDSDGFFATGVKATKVKPNQMTTVKINGQKIVLTRYEETIHAYGSECPHAAADLSQGEAARWKVFCPDHGYCFDMRNGRTLWPEDEPLRLKTFPVKIEDGLVKVKV